MNKYQKLLSLAIILATSACIPLDDVQHLDNAASYVNGAWSPSPTKRFMKFYCDNGYKGSVKVRPNDVVSLSYSDGKHSYISYMNALSTDVGELYVNKKNTLRWHHQMGKATFSYPAPDYGTTKQLLSTSCQVR